MRKIRGKQISMIFQDPMTSLNPVITVGEQIMEVIRLHDKKISKKDAYTKACEMLDICRKLKRTGLALSASVLRRYETACNHCHGSGM